MKRTYIPVAQPALIGFESKYVNDCLVTSWISSKGKYIELFEREFANYVGVKYAASCSNGTVALHLALLAAGVKSGDEIICPTFTYVATANSISYVGASPVLVDCEDATFNIDATKIEKVITKQTKAILIAHIYGHPCEMDEILKVAKKHNLILIEDGAEALGSVYRGKMIGGFGHIATFSFFGNKVITTGEGGMVVTNNKKFDAAIRLYKGQGVDPIKQYWFKVLGYNYRMTNIQAAIGLAQLKNIKKFLNKRRLIASWYNKSLSDLEGIFLPIEKEYVYHSYWMYSILVRKGKDRNKLMAYLKKQNIETRPFFYPMHIMPVHNQGECHLPISVDISKRGINLPTFYDLTRQEVEYISSKIREYFMGK